MKKIWKDEKRFVFSEDAFIYEVDNKWLSGRKLQPTFENRFWEVYALHRECGLYYAIIWKYQGERKFFKNALLFSRAGRFFLPIGRDLSMKAMGDVQWAILSYNGKNLVNTTDQFLVMPNLMITWIEYHSPVVSMTQKAPYGGKFKFETTAYWKQKPKGYEQLEEKNVKQEILNGKDLPEDPWFV